MYTYSAYKIRAFLALMFGAYLLDTSIQSLAAESDTPAIVFDLVLLLCGAALVLFSVRSGWLILSVHRHQAEEDDHWTQIESR